MNSTTNSIPMNYNVNENFDSDDTTGTESTNSNTSTFGDMFYSIFNKSNIILFLWFLAIYFVAYYVLGFLFNKNEDGSNYQLRLSRTIDIIALLSVLMIIISTYAGYSNNQKENLVKNIASQTSTFINDPMSIVTMIVFFICFYIVVYLFRLPMDRETKPVIVSIVEGIAWILFVIILFTDFFKYVLNISFTDGIAKLFDWDSLPDYAPAPKGNTKLNGNSYVGNTYVSGNLNLSDPVQKNEVFNISNNLYTYDDAQAICSAYGAKIATYDQIEEAYKQGAEWCNYGWSDGQMAFFPTQKSTWNMLQETDNHKNDCGRPGINGGYFANPYIKFGVNCFGKKPDPTDDEIARMNAIHDKTYPKTSGDSLLDKKIAFWKENAQKLLVLNSFNKNEWSEY